MPQNVADAISFVSRFKCMVCEGSEELQAVIQTENASDQNNIGQASNVTLNGAIGYSRYEYSPEKDIIGFRLSPQATQGQHNSKHVTFRYLFDLKRS
jgi:hypothetical protein